MLKQVAMENPTAGHEDSEGKRARLLSGLLKFSTAGLVSRKRVLAATLVTATSLLSGATTAGEPIGLGANLDRARTLLRIGVGETATMPAEIVGVELELTSRRILIRINVALGSREATEDHPFCELNQVSKRFWRNIVPTVFALQPCNATSPSCSPAGRGVIQRCRPKRPVSS